MNSTRSTLPTLSDAPRGEQDDAHLAPTPSPPGTVEFVLTHEQAAALAHWTNKPGLAVVIGCIHPGRFDGPAAGRIVARVGAIPAGRLGAVRAAALEIGRNRSRSSETIPNAKA